MCECARQRPALAPQALPAYNAAPYFQPAYFQSYGGSGAFGGGGGGGGCRGGG